MTDPAKNERTPVSLYQIYAEELRIHAVRLIWLAHKQLNAGSFATKEEDDITGELVRAMRLVVQDRDAESWVEHYEIREQARQNVGGKKGKRRPIIDIEVERHQRGPRPCLCFEAKRLGRKCGLGGKRGYLGEEGLAAFLTGHYSTMHDEAGMLGYIQADTVEKWSLALGRELLKKALQHRVINGTQLQKEVAGSEMPFFRSTHTDTKSHRFLVIHVLLPFTAQ